MYPVLVSLSMMILFSISLLKPPTVIEVFARRQEGRLSSEAVSYTRKVTIVWCVFFLLNAIVSAYTAFASRELWLIYNGFVSYLLIASLFALEYLVRQRVKKRAR